MLLVQKFLVVTYKVAGDKYIVLSEESVMGDLPKAKRVAKEIIAAEGLTVSGAIKIDILNKEAAVEFNRRRANVK